MGYSEHLTAKQKWRIFKVQMFLDQGITPDFWDTCPAGFIADVVSYRDGMSKANGR
jgi:hypothetical protein